MHQQYLIHCCKFCNLLPLESHGVYKLKMSEEKVYLLLFERHQALLCYHLFQYQHQISFHYIRKVFRYILVLFLQEFLLLLRFETLRQNVGFQVLFLPAPVEFCHLTVDFHRFADCPKTKKILVKRQRMWYN